MFFLAFFWTMHSLLQGAMAAAGAALAVTVFVFAALCMVVATISEIFRQFGHQV